MTSTTMNYLFEGLSKPLDQILDNQTILLHEIVKAAHKSVIYSDKLKRYSLSKLTELKYFPISTYKDFTKAISVDSEIALLAEDSIKSWHTSGTTGKPKTFYNSQHDLDFIGITAARGLFLGGVNPGEVVLNLGAGHPWASSAVGHLACKALDTIEIGVPISDEADLIIAMSQVIKVGHVEGIIGVPTLSLLIKYALSDFDYTRKRLTDQIQTEKTKIALSLLENLDIDKILQIFSNVKVGAFGGASPYQFRLELLEILPNAAIIDLYGGAEMGVAAIQYEVGEGLRPNLDWIIMEIVPLDEFSDWQSGKIQCPQALLPQDWYRGLVGQLIVTPGTTCMPKIRLEVGDIVEVVEPRRLTNARGFMIELPVIKVLGRQNEIIPFGNCYMFKGKIIEALNSNFINGQVRWWDVYMKDGKVKLEIIPTGEVLEESLFVKEIKEAVVENNIGSKQEYLANPSRLDVTILKPGDFDRVEDDIASRRKLGKPLGQIKPQQIHVG